MKIAHWGLGILLALPTGFAAGQSQAPAQSAPTPAPATADSLAAAAKQARDAKKDQAKPARVWDNDSVPKADAAISVVGQGPAQADRDNPAAATDDNANATAPAGDGSNAATDGSAPAAPGPGRAALDGDIANAKEKLSTIKVDLDLLQRTYTLDAQMYYGKPDYSTDTDGAAKLKDEQDQIAAKQQEMDDQQKKIDDLEAEKAKLPPESAGDSSDTSK
ncbi:MAG: hypothetical protein WA192_14025 [Candidatus Acidiferrales bacterium]